jgi:hypothetical protein
MEVGVKGRATATSLPLATGEEVGWISEPFWK